MIRVMHDEVSGAAQPLLEYHRPAVREEIRLHVGRVLALGYVGLCVVALIAMGVVMAARL